MHAWEKGTGKRNQDPWDSGSQRYILNSVTRSGHIPAVWRSTNGIFRIAMAMRTAKVDREQIWFGTFADKTKSRVWHVYLLTEESLRDTCTRVGLSDLKWALSRGDCFLRSGIANSHQRIKYIFSSDTRNGIMHVAWNERFTYRGTLTYIIKRRSVIACANCFVVNRFLS